MKRQARREASKRPTVLLPEPMNPVKQTMRHSGTGPVEDFSNRDFSNGDFLNWESSDKRFRARQLSALENFPIVPLKEESSTLA